MQRHHISEAVLWSTMVMFQEYMLKNLSSVRAQIYDKENFVDEDIEKKTADECQQQVSI